MLSRFATFLQGSKTQFTGVALEDHTPCHRSNTASFSSGIQVWVLLAYSSYRMGTCHLNGIGLSPGIKEFLAFSLTDFSLVTGISGAIRGLGVSCIGHTHVQ